MTQRAYGLPVSELSSDRSVGLLQAVRRLHPERALRLPACATWWIWAAIHEHILHLHFWSVVKTGTTRAQKTLFVRLRRLRSELHVIDDGDLSHQQVGKIAHLLDAPENEERG